MFVAKSFALAPAVVILLSGASHAALTADQVWQSWQKTVTEQGGKIEAATSARSGSTLTLNGVSIGGAEGPALTFSDLALTELSNGTVEIKPGATIAGDLSEGDSSGSVKINHDNLIIIASESGEDSISYELNADKVTLAVDSNQPGYSFSEEPAKPIVMTLNADIEGLSGSFSDVPGTLRVLDFEASAKSLKYTTLSEDPNMGSKITNESEAVDLKGVLNIALPSDLKMADVKSAEDFHTALSKGFAVEGNLLQGKSSMQSKEENDYLPFEMSGAMEPTNFDFSFKKEGFKLNSAAEGGIINFVSAMVPAPIEVTLGQMGFAFASPVMALTEPEEYYLKLNLDSIAVNEEAWAIVDPEGKLKHEPLIATVDISGQALLDVASMTGTLGAAMPSPQSLDINAVALQIAGAALTTTGAFTFDNSAGTPVPVGNADVALKGVDQLVNGLIALGMISEEDAMGARMMIGMFMQPGSEPDSYVSKIEAKEGGSLFVNGQQVQ